MTTLSTTPLPEWIADLAGLDGSMGSFVGGIVGALVIVSLLLAMSAVAGPWAKRKITAAFTDRIAVSRLGPFGLFFIVADSIRLLSKELIIPENADRPAYDIAPIIIVLSALLGFAIIPMGSIAGVEFQLADPDSGLVLLFAFSSLATIGLVVGGYASANKYSTLGSLRSVAQSVAYEIPLVVIAISVVLLVGGLGESNALALSTIVEAQQQELVSVAGLSIPAWFIFLNPFAFILFLVASLAEVGRNPFDIPEAPTEIVAGYQTEYSSVYFVLFYLGEFLHIFLSAGIITVLFLGGGSGPVLPGLVWFIIKLWIIFLLTQWARAALPRFRIDQLIAIGWKGLLVLSFANLILTAVIVGVIV
ncbi:NADH-quinone oxidoreductase subunit H [Salinarchaeum sp. IM2453]|uniref:complex I subunit 1/NuoH family protein n=1 Tax=Salinarchaeum sp. IM2453 TaxID=2862870 RepID=UPI001C83782C|nr:complex I subunit 1 family protein [Salinarchaeum sp. IM2453]QZA87726.1 NADH-quinone oxidoreductase subunit H [Salinarchaeum sp. IM2453]